MKNAAVNAPPFLEAVAAIDAGDLPALQLLLQIHPQLVSMRHDYPEQGYFKNPYLFWFIADNPIRQEQLPANIVAITQWLASQVQQGAPESFQQQIDYALGLVVTGRIPRDAGVQTALMDVLIDAGAKPGQGHGALAHGNLGAALHLLKRGGPLTLATAVCLDRTDDILELAKESVAADRETALVAAAFYGKPEMLQFLIALGVDVNAWLDPSCGFHSHATALHQAVFSGSLEAVKTLVEAGADTAATDRIFQGTPMGWAVHLQTEIGNATTQNKYLEIELFLRNQEGDNVH